MAEETRDLGNGLIELAPRTGTSFTMKKGDRLVVIDPQGSQVADLLAYNAEDTRETLSNGRTFDYAGRILLTTGDKLYSNRSNVLLTIASDTVGRHDFTFTPCSRRTFEIRYPELEPHPGCFGNFAHALQRHGLGEDAIPVPFNAFMYVDVNGETGAITVKPPLSKANDHVDFIAEMDLIVALTACSAPRSNAGVMKPIQYRLETR